MSNPFVELDRCISTLTAPGQFFETETIMLQGHLQQVYKHIDQNMREYFKKSLDHSDKPFIVYNQERYSFADVYQLAKQFACALLDNYDISKGDRVAIAMRNNPQWIVAYMGALSVGAVVVPMNAWWTSSELREGFVDCGAKIVVSDCERAERISAFSCALNIRQIVVAPIDSGVSAKQYSEQETDFYALVSSYSAAEMPDVPIEPDDDAIIMYTSGSTGTPKGAVSTHRAVLSALNSWLLVAISSRTHGRTRSDLSKATKPTQERLQKAANRSPASATLLTIPLFHVTGSHSVFLLSIVAGRKLVMMDKWDVDEALQLIEKEKITTFSGVPTMSAELQVAAQDSHCDLSSLKDIVSGGAARPPRQVKKIASTFDGARVGTGYGSTETNGVGAVNAGQFYEERPASTGRAVPAVTTLKIVAEDGRPLSPGEKGEICIKSAANAYAYWGREEETKKSFIDGWFHTGDVGYLDEHGFLYVVDRIKDIIIRGGENISCLEVESAIYEHSAIDEVAVFGLPDERLNEIVGAAVVLHSGHQLDAESLRQFLSQRLAKFKIPAHIWFVNDKLPRLATGKIYKRQLKEKYRDLISQVVA